MGSAVTFERPEAGTLLPQTTSGDASCARSHARYGRFRAAHRPVDGHRVERARHPGNVREPLLPLTTRRLDARRIVDADRAGEVGVEFLFVSQGVSLEGLPRRDEIAAALHAIAQAV